MDLQRFRQIASWTLEEVANRLKDGDERFAKVNASLVRRHEVGRHFPSPELIERYAEITEGAVTYSDWLAARQAARSAEATA